MLTISFYCRASIVFHPHVSVLIYLYYLFIQFYIHFHTHPLYLTLLLPPFFLIAFYGTRANTYVFTGPAADFRAGPRTATTLVPSRSRTERLKG
jgi:hypothetical protein